MQVYTDENSTSLLHAQAGQLKAGKLTKGLSAGLGGKTRKPFGNISKNTLNSKKGVLQSKKGLDKSDTRAKARKAEVKPALGYTPKSSLTQDTRESKPEYRLPRSEPQDVGPTSGTKTSTSFSRGLSDVIPHSPSDNVLRKNLLQEAILSNCENFKEVVQKEKEKLNVAQVPPSPTDMIFKKNLRREAILLSARGKEAAIITKEKKENRTFPPSPSDLELHRNLRQEAITLNARKQAAMESSIENLVSKFNSSKGD